MNCRLQRHDVELSYSVEGRGLPVLMIQGVSTAGCAWKPQVETLKSEFEILTFDNRGLGGSLPCTGPISIESMADDARALMDKLGWENAHVVGHSMGGVIAQQLAVDHPNRVRSLSLLCTFARGKDAARLTPWVLWMTLRTRLGTLAMRRRAFLEMLWPLEELARLDQDALAAKLSPLLGRDLAAQPAVALKQLRAMARSDLSSRLSELRGVPTWVLSAQHDHIAHPRYGQKIAELVPGAIFELMDACSHGVTLHRPDRINDKLRRFLISVEEERGRNITT